MLFGAVECANGDTLAKQQSQASSKENVMKSIRHGHFQCCEPSWVNRWPRAEIQCSG